MLLMALLHLPFLTQKLLPFAILFGTMFTFQRLTRTHELVAARAVGVSVWQLLLPALLVTLALGVFTVSAFNPIGAAAFTRYEQLERGLLEQDTNLLSLSSGGLWLRQSDGADEIVIHARLTSQEPMRLHQVVVFRYRDEVRFDARIDAASAVLEPDRWLLQGARVFHADGSTEHHASLALPTELTRERIHNSFAPPETISFWDLPAFVELMEAVGFPPQAHLLHWHSLLALPLLLCAMLLIGTAFSLRLTRRGGTGLLVVGGLITGFAFYVLSDVILAIGLSGRIPAALAAWTPAGAAVLVGLGALFHLEDG